VCSALASSRQPASLHVSDSGSNSCVLGRPSAPTTRTLPEGSRVAVCRTVGARSEPVRRQVPEAGS
jgi:hypothetical protein